MISIKHIIKVFGACMVVMIVSPPINAQVPAGLPTIDARTSVIWDAIAPYFSPPKKYKGKYGKYRSLLKFYGGDSVKMKQDWQKRRKEIRARWQHMMGEWPPLLRKQKMEVKSFESRNGYTQKRIKFNWTPHERTEGYLLIPDDSGSKKKPAVITVYYEPETAVGRGNPHLDWASQLVKRGFVTLSLGVNSSLYYPSIDNAQIEPLSMLGYAAANAWYVLSKVPQVDSTRIGIMGHSFGGKWAMFASCLFDKFAASVWSDPGIVFDDTARWANYWDPWYLGYYPPPWHTRGMPNKQHPAQGLYPKLRAEGYNLHELHALMAPRPFLVSGGSVDGSQRWVPLNHSIAVNRLLGYENRVAMTNRELHTPNPHSNQVVYLFFEYFLKRNGLSVKNP